MEVGLAAEGLTNLQRTNLSLGLVLFVGALLTSRLSELDLLYHDRIFDIIDMDTVD